MSLLPYVRKKEENDLAVLMSSESIQYDVQESVFDFLLRIVELADTTEVRLQFKGHLKEYAMQTMENYVEVISLLTKALEEEGR